MIVVASTVMVFNIFNMDNSDQKVILKEQAFNEIKELCKKFQNDSGSSNSEVKALLKELTFFWETEKKNKFGFQ